MHCVVIGDKPLTDPALQQLKDTLADISRIYFELEFLIAGSDDFKAAAVDICSELCGDNYYQNYRIVTDTGESGPHRVVLPDVYMIKPEYLDHWRDRVLFSKAEYAVICTSSRTPAMSEWVNSHSAKFHTII